MNNFNWSKLKTFKMLLMAALVIYSCSKEPLENDLQDTNALSAQMLKVVQAGSCEADCIEPGSEDYYPVSDMALLSVGINTKSVSYTAYNTETDFVVEVTYAITAGPSNAKASITIDIDGDEMEYKKVSSGSTVSHMVPLAEGWAGCNEVSFSIEQKGLGLPITFSESYSLIPVCEEDSLEIGMEYQGGIIAYILQPGDPGYDTNVTHGIIAAPSDQSTGIGLQWYNGSYIVTGATGTALGTGQANTTAIVNSQGAGSYAASVCNDLVLNDYDDWYLPSKDELNKLFRNKDAIGGLFGFYWSSSEIDLRNAWNQYFHGGNQEYYTKRYQRRVRAVRAF